MTLSASFLKCAKSWSRPEHGRGEPKRPRPPLPARRPRPRGRVAYGAWVSKATRPYGSQWRVGFASNPDAQWGLTLFNGRWSDYWVAQAPVPDGEWTHVVAAADQTVGQLRYYVNGRPAGGSSALQPFLASAAPLYVGFQTDDGVFYSGDVDDLRVWDRTLGAAEAAALFRSE